MALPLVTKTQIVQALDDLSPENLVTVAEFVEFLRTKTTQSMAHRITKLGGLWQGYTFSDEDVQSARRAVWASLGRDING